jgi:hypothetical protein
MASPRCARWRDCKSEGRHLGRRARHRDLAALVTHQRLRDGTADTSCHGAKLETARFYAGHVLARASDLAHSVAHDAESALAIEDDQF